MNFLKGVNANYLVTLFFLLLSCNANFLTSTDVLWLLIVVVMFVYALRKNLFLKEDFKHITIFGLVFLAFVAIRDMLINNLEAEFLLSDVIFLFKYVMLSFVFCTILKDKAMAYIVKVVTHLTVVSFFFYAIQLVAGQFLYMVFKAIDLPNNNALTNNITGSYTNILIFTFTKDFHDLSNSGFVWEPGSFGCFLIITLMFHFFMNNFRFDRTAIILIIGNFTTFSTTAYIGMMVLLLMAYRYRIPKINLWFVLALVSVALLVTFIPILGQKIVDTYTEDLGDLKHLKVLERYYHHYRMEIPLNRFASMVYIYNTFGIKLILGVSNKYNLIFNRTFNVNVSNGIFDFLAKFGLVSFGYLMYKYAKLCYRYVKKVEFVIYCVLILLLLGFGEPIMILPLVLNFLFLSETQTNILPTVSKRKSREHLKQYLNNVPPNLNERKRAI